MLPNGFRTRPARLLSVAIAACTIGASAGHAFDRTDYEAMEGTYVTATSDFGHGTVSGPVRYTPQGRQVRLPGGSWIWCGKSCAETLRLQSVDFWEYQNGLTQGPGIFGKLEFGW